MTITKSSSTIARIFFQYLNDENFSYAVLGDADAFPAVATDVDICVESWKDFLSVIRAFCNSTDISLANITIFSNGAKFDLCRIDKVQNTVSLLIVDVIQFPTAKLKRRIGFTLSELARSSRPSTSGILVPPARLAFLFHLLKYVDKKAGSEIKHQYLTRLWTEDPEGVRQLLLSLWSPRSANVIIHSIENSRLDDLLSAIPTLHRELSKKFSWSPQRTFWILKWLLARALSPVGVDAAFVGPDGSGKSSVIDAVAQDLDTAFRTVHCFHLTPSFNPNPTNMPPNTAPHEDAPRSAGLSIAKIIYLWIRYSLGWLLIVWPNKVRLNLTLFDRYYHDILVDPRRYRYGGPMWFARWIGKIVPSPALWILLDCPAETLQRRKQEVSYDESAFQRSKYLSLIKSKKNGVVLDANCELSEVVASARVAILEYMIRRAAKRFGS